MALTVKFDLRGDRRLVFEDDGVTHITKELYPVPLPGHLIAARIVTNRSIPYRDINWVGLIRRKQWWASLLGLIFTLLGMFWMITNFGNWGPFGFGAFCFLVLGLFPLWLFVRGRSFVAIASDHQVICFPSDRKRKQVRQALVILKELLPPDHVQWTIHSEQLTDPDHKSDADNLQRR